MLPALYDASLWICAANANFWADLHQRVYPGESVQRSRNKYLAMVKFTDVTLLPCVNSPIHAGLGFALLVDKKLYAKQ